MVWKNESQRHSMAKKGIRTGKLKYTTANGKRHEFADDLDFWNREQIKEFEEQFGEIKSVDERGNGEYYIETDSGEYRVFTDYETARQIAIDELVDMWESDSGSFPVDWVVESNIYITDTDKRILANEIADNDVSDLDDDEIFEKAEYYGHSELKEEKENNEEKIGDLEDEIDSVEEKQEKTQSDKRYLFYDDKIDKLKEEIEKLEKKNENLVDQARDNVIHEIYEETKEALDDPIQYFVKEQGLYTKEDLLEQNFIGIDYEGMAKDVLDSDGVGHILASYDGDEDEIGNSYIYRVN